MFRDGDEHSAPMWYMPKGPVFCLNSKNLFCTFRRYLGLVKVFVLALCMLVSPSFYFHKNHLSLLSYPTSEDFHGHSTSFWHVHASLKFYFLSKHLFFPLFLTSKDNHGQSIHVRHMYVSLALFYYRKLLHFRLWEMYKDYGGHTAPIKCMSTISTFYFTSNHLIILLYLTYGKWWGPSICTLPMPACPAICFIQSFWLLLLSENIQGLLCALHAITTYNHWFRILV